MLYISAHYNQSIAESRLHFCAIYILNYILQSFWLTTPLIKMIELFSFLQRCIVPTLTTWEHFPTVLKTWSVWCALALLAPHNRRGFYDTNHLTHRDQGHNYLHAVHSTAGLEKIISQFFFLSFSWKILN